MNINGHEFPEPILDQAMGPMSARCAELIWAKPLENFPAELGEIERHEADEENPGPYFVVKNVKVGRWTLYLQWPEQEWEPIYGPPGDINEGLLLDFKVKE
jgi:hypothetical protein